MSFRRTTSKHHQASTTTCSNQQRTTMSGSDASSADKQVRVGVGVIVRRGQQILLGLRHGSLGAGEWALPGGHLEHGESLEECATREVLEETGIQIECVGFAAVENAVFPTGQHYLVVFMSGIAPTDAEATVREPTKCRGWSWVDWHSLPSPLFQPLQQLVARGFTPPGLDGC